MFILLTIISAVLFIIGIWLSADGELELRMYDRFSGRLVVGTSLAIIGFIALIICSCNLISLSDKVDTIHTIDDNIASYETQNAALAEEITLKVNNHLGHNEDGLKYEFKPENAQDIFVFCPELDSDKLLVKQIDTYMANNEKLLELERERSEISKAQWWLNFRN